MTPDFKSWYETMCTEFPTRFSRLFRGPMWNGVPKQLQGSPHTVSTTIYFTVKNLWMSRKARIISTTCNIYTGINLYILRQK